MGKKPHKNPLTITTNKKEKTQTDKTTGKINPKPKQNKTKNRREHIYIHVC